MISNDSTLKRKSFKRGCTHTHQETADNKKEREERIKNDMKHFEQCEKFEKEIKVIYCDTDILLDDEKPNQKIECPYCNSQNTIAVQTSHLYCLECFNYRMLKKESCSALAYR